MNDKTGLLIGVKAAAEHLQVSRPTIYKYMKLGMPAFPVPSGKGRFTYHFYVDNIEAFWSKLTKMSIKNPEKIVENDDDLKQCQEKSVSKSAKKRQ